MVSEHGITGSGFATTRDLKGGCEPPEGACNNYQAMLKGLAEFEQGMHRHVHKESSLCRSDDHHLCGKAGPRGQVSGARILGCAVPYSYACSAR